MLKNCVVCGNEFETNHPIKKSCSIICAKELKKISDKKFNKSVKRKEAQKVYLKKYYKSAKGKATIKANKKARRVRKNPKKNKTCIVCGVEFEAVKKKICSKECVRKRQYDSVAKQKYKASDRYKKMMQNYAKTPKKKEMKTLCRIFNTSYVPLDIKKIVAINYAFNINKLNKETLDAIERGETLYAYR